MTYRRINIQVRDNIDPAVAAQRVATVIAGGRISGNGEYYCWVTTFTDGTVVYTRGPGKQFASSDSFIVYKQQGEMREEESGSTKA
jgi:hypothetical protein